MDDKNIFYTDKAETRSRISLEQLYSSLPTKS